MSVFRKERPAYEEAQGSSTGRDSFVETVFFVEPAVYGNSDLPYDSGNPASFSHNYFSGVNRGQIAGRADF